METDRSSDNGVRWSRAFAIIHRSEAVVRHQIRPRTQFDNVNQADIEYIFNKSAPLGFEYGAFTNVMKKLGFNNGRVVRHVFDMACCMSKGEKKKLPKHAAACAMLLLVKGTSVSI